MEEINKGGLVLQITIDFETKINANNNIMQLKNFKFQNVSGRLEQEAKKFLVQLEGNDEDVLSALRYIWELLCLYDGYFYAPRNYIVNGVNENIEKLYFLSFYQTGRIWRNCATTLVGADKDFSEERMLKYSEFRNKGRTSGKLFKSLINSFFYLRSDAYERVNVNHRLSLYL